MKAATLDPWSNLNIDAVQAIVDHVYGAHQFEVKEDGPWLGLVTARLQGWRNHIGTKAFDVVRVK